MSLLDFKTKIQRQISHIHNVPVPWTLSVWFDAMHGFTYDDDHHILTNFTSLVKHLQAEQQDKFRYLFARLVECIQTGKLVFSASSGCLEYVQTFFLRLGYDGLDSTTTTRKNIECFCRTTIPNRCPDSYLKSLHREIVSGLSEDLSQRTGVELPGYKKTRLSALDKSLSESADSAVDGEAQDSENYRSSGVQTVNHPQISKQDVSAAHQAKGARYGIKSIPEWFGQFTGYTYDDRKHVLVNLEALTQHLKFARHSNHYVHTFQSLLGVIKAGYSPYPRQSGCNKYAKSYFSRFDGFEYKVEESLLENIFRLSKDPSWPRRWAKHNTKPAKQARQVIDLAIHQDNERRYPKTRKTATMPVPDITNLSIRPAAGPQVKSATTLPASDKADHNRFFDRYPHFIHEPTEPLMAEFERLAISQSWKQGSKVYKKQKSAFIQARFEDEWEELNIDDSDDDQWDDGQIGVDISQAARLSTYQNLCTELGIEPCPKSICQCRKAIAQLNVNIVDLLEARHENNRRADGTVAVRRFGSTKALMKYSLREDKVYPRTAAKEQGALKTLLKDFFRSNASNASVGRVGRSVA